MKSQLPWPLVFSSPGAHLLSKLNSQPCGGGQWSREGARERYRERRERERPLISSKEEMTGVARDTKMHQADLVGFGFCFLSFLIVLLATVTPYQGTGICQPVLYFAWCKKKSVRPQVSMNVWSDTLRHIEVRWWNQCCLVQYTSNHILVILKGKTSSNWPLETELGTNPTAKWTRFLFVFPSLKRVFSLALKKPSRTC